MSAVGTTPAFVRSTRRGGAAGPPVHPPAAPPPHGPGCLLRGFREESELAFAGPGVGWHYETGVQLMRLILAGTLDRHPDLQIILGHWGEVVLFYLERMESLNPALKLDRPLRDYFRQNVFYTPSGILSQACLQRTLEIAGVERVMFSADYPFQETGGGRAREFLERAELAPEERELIAHGNWERLLAR
ncbi:amidohydrolase family protein [Streptomyces sp. Edi2]|uniref:amidohydrolase family protein n=1 Tax=Streptomyces sp. Edi2 TaxID=3162528 RepID=UPI0033056F1B